MSNPSRQVPYVCRDCGHMKMVTEIITGLNTFIVGGSANWCDKCGDGLPVRQVVQQAKQLAQRQPQPEPVAWWCKHPHGGGFMTCDKMAADHYMHKLGGTENGQTLVPLYAAPQPQQTEPSQDTPPQRTPLTREQIDAVWSSLGSFTDRESDYRIFARAVERAHGIGEKP